MENDNGPNGKKSSDLSSPAGRRRSIMIIDEKGKKEVLEKKNQACKEKPSEECMKDTTCANKADDGVIIVNRDKKKQEKEVCPKDQEPKDVCGEHEASCDTCEEKKCHEKKPCEKKPCEEKPCEGKPCEEKPCEEKPCEGKPCKEGDKQPDKKVTFDEGSNKEYDVQKDRNKATPLSPREHIDGKTEHVKKSSLEDVDKAFVPPTLAVSSLDASSGILKDRSDNNVSAEGWMWKKRRIFKCFWHQKYFILTKDGILKYYKADGRRAAKGNWDMKEATEVDQHDIPEETHPFRITISSPSCCLLLGFDEKDVRDYWVNVLNRTVRKE